MCGQSKTSFMPSDHKQTSTHSTRTSYRMIYIPFSENFDIRFIIFKFYIVSVTPAALSEFALATRPFFTLFLARRQTRTAHMRFVEAAT